MTKELCLKCKKNIAVWDYMPGFSNGDISVFCDDCVPRGCDCNYIYLDVDAYDPPLDNPSLPEGIEGVDWKWIEKDRIWVDIDEKGREYPCSEYMWDSDGWERELNPHIDESITPDWE